MICGETLAAFDDDNQIPVYGFGDARTHDSAVFSFVPGDAPASGFDGVLAAYRAIMPSVSLAGPTSFGPAIRRAIQAVKDSGGQYHVAVIICDGQMTRATSVDAGELSPQERDTVNAIVEASSWPLSIVCIGVGDGDDGWQYMKELDDHVPERAFDNFQFVPFDETLARAQRSAASSGSDAASIKRAMEATFALHALMELPQQFHAINTLGLLGSAAVAYRRAPEVLTMEPPVAAAGVAVVSAAAAGGDSGGARAAVTAGGACASDMVSAGADAGSSPPPTTSNKDLENQASSRSSPAASSWGTGERTAGGSNSARSGGSSTLSAPDDESARLRRELDALSAERTCPVCLERATNLVFSCGHQVCTECAPPLLNCPVCRVVITARIKLY